MDFDKIDTSGDCWLWLGYKDKAGYGKIGDKLAHRVSYELAVEPIPDGLCVRHKCRSRACVNPEHLETGTHLENMRDKIRDGTSHRLAGERNPKSKLTQEQVATIRLRHSNGESQSALGREYGVSQASIWLIIKISTWK